MREIAVDHDVSVACVSLNVRRQRNAAPRRSIDWLPLRAVECGWDLNVPRISRNGASPLRLTLDTTGMLQDGDRLIAEGRWRGVAHPSAVSLPREISLTPRACRLIGLYLAEGHVSKHNLGFSFHEKEVEYAAFVTEALADLFGLRSRIYGRPAAHSQQVMASSKAVARTFASQFGKGAHEKRFPQSWLEELNDASLAALVQGVFEGDGCASTRTLTTVSETLARQIGDALMRLGRPCSVSQYRKVWKGRHGKAWKVREHFVADRYREGENGGWFSVSNFEHEDYSGQVYNLEVAEDHSYVVESVAVHNCWKISDSFVKFHNKPDCYYGKVYEARKAQEVGRNEAGNFKALAAKTLKERSFRDEETRECYKSGRLPKGRLELRARRVAVKRFLAHWWAIEYQIRTGKPAPRPWIIEQGGHVDYDPPPNWPMAEDLPPAKETERAVCHEKPENPERAG